MIPPQSQLEDPFGRESTSATDVRSVSLILRGLVSLGEPERTRVLDDSLILKEMVGSFLSLSIFFCGCSPLGPAGEILVRGSILTGLLVDSKRHSRFAPGHGRLAGCERTRRSSTFVLTRRADGCGGLAVFMVVVRGARSLRRDHQRGVHRLRPVPDRPAAHTCHVDRSGTLIPARYFKDFAGYRQAHGGSS